MYVVLELRMKVQNDEFAGPEDAFPRMDNE